METDRMAALGFSVLMREWRRGMAFDPWHWKPLFKTVSGHHSPCVFFLRLCYRDEGSRPAVLDQIKSSRASRASFFFFFFLDERDPAGAAASTLTSSRVTPRPPRRKASSLIDHLEAGRKGGEPICENIILFVEHCSERGSQSSRSSFISNVCPNRTRASWFLRERLATVAADAGPKTISLETKKFPSRVLVDSWKFKT